MKLNDTNVDQNLVAKIWFSLGLDLHFTARSMCESLILYVYGSVPENQMSQYKIVFIHLDSKILKFVNEKTLA